MICIISEMMYKILFGKNVLKTDGNAHFSEILRVIVISGISSFAKGNMFLIYYQVVSCEACERLCFENNKVLGNYIFPAYAAY